MRPDSRHFSRGSKRQDRWPGRTASWIGAGFALVYLGAFCALTATRTISGTLSVALFGAFIFGLLLIAAITDEMRDRQATDGRPR